MTILEKIIDISTEQKKQELYNIFDSFKSIKGLCNYFKVSDNTKNVSFIRQIAKEIGFDLNIYNERQHPKRYCKQCGKLLTGQQTKFCSSSCAASYNNKLRGPMKEETKQKIKETYKNNHLGYVKPVKIKKQKKIIEKYCSWCGKILTNTNNKYCCTECMEHAHYKKQKEAYEQYLLDPTKYCRPNYMPKRFRKFILEEQDYKCAICGLPEEWNGNHLVFIMDHIDGNASNNSRDNLRLICPNCDSQLDTYKSKNKHSARHNYTEERIRKAVIKELKEENKI